MTIAFSLLPPVVDPIAHSTPLTVLSAAAFLVMAIAAFFVALRRPAWAMGLIAFAIPFAFYRDVAGTTLAKLCSSRRRRVVHRGRSGSPRI